MLCQAQLGSRAPPINHGARQKLWKIPEYYGFLKHCRLLRSIDRSWWRPEREHSVDIHNYAGTGDGVGDC